MLDVLGQVIAHMKVPILLVNKLNSSFHFCIDYH